ASRLLSGHDLEQQYRPGEAAHREEATTGQQRNEPTPPDRLQSGTDAKKIEAARRIAFSSASRLFSARSRRISSDSADVTPGRAPSSMSACATQRRNDSRAIPSWAPTATDAAVTDP